MAVSKVFIAKSFAALSATSVVGTGAANFFQTKDINRKIQNEIKKKFLNQNNRQVLENAGFKDASTDEEILKKSLSLRLSSEKVTTETVNKIINFCKLGMNISFEGIEDVYKALATLCSRTITLEGKVQRDKLNLAGQDDVSQKLSLITSQNRKRSFVSSLEREDADSLLKACQKFGSKDVFSYEITKEILADYMTFCVKEKPSVIRFWTGINDPADIADYWEKIKANESTERQNQAASSGEKQTSTEGGREGTEVSNPKQTETGRSTQEQEEANKREAGRRNIQKTIVGKIGSGSL